MPDRRASPFSLTRRTLFTLAGGALALNARAGHGQTATSSPQPLRMENGTVPLRSGAPATVAWRFTPEALVLPPATEGAPVELTNALPGSVHLTWHGLDGMTSAEPLIAQPAFQPGTSRRAALRASGTYFLESRLGGDRMDRPLPGAALVVRETAPPEVDRDEVLLIEDWRLAVNGTLLTPGRDSSDATTIYTINGKRDWNILTRTHERLRLRIINGCHRAVIALRIDGHEPQIIAIDGRPAEPFPARDGRMILAPGARIDTLIDAVKPPRTVSPIHLHDGTSPRPIATLSYSDESPVRSAPLSPAQPLQRSGLPARLPLQGAQRFTLSFGAEATEWHPADGLSLTLPPAFRARRGQTVVLAITNHSQAPATFRLHGHPFRLLDRLDDGWKPFWLDTLLFDAGQTHRIAFLAEYPGAWLLEFMGIAWTAPRLLRWFAVA